MSVVSKLKEKSKPELIKKIIDLREGLYYEKNLKPSSCKGYQPKDSVDPDNAKPPDDAKSVTQGANDQG